MTSNSPKVNMEETWRNTKGKLQAVLAPHSVWAGLHKEGIFIFPLATSTRGTLGVETVWYVNSWAVGRCLKCFRKEWALPSQRDNTFRTMQSIDQFRVICLRCDKGADEPLAKKTSPITDGWQARDGFHQWTDPGHSVDFDLFLFFVDWIGSGSVVLKLLFRGLIHG